MKVSRRTLSRAVVVLVIAGAAFTAFNLVRAARAGRDGKTHLLQAERDVVATHVRPARRDLESAAADFRAMRRDLHGVGMAQVMAVAKVIPFVRVQARAVNAIADAGFAVSQAGIPIVDAAASVEAPTGDTVPLSDSLDKLRAVEASLRTGVAALDRATARVSALDHDRLVYPLGSAQRDLSRRLAHIDSIANTAVQGLAALIMFTGGSGPRHYLLLSQNPDEVRPTGGFIGSYGVLTADSGHVHLDRYAPIEEWGHAHPNAAVPPSQVGSPFRFYNPPLQQSIANINASPDWPKVAQLGLSLWQSGGEAPTDGVVSFTPEFLSRVLAVTGPVEVPGYETVTADNVVERLNFYTHVLKPGAGTTPKAFLAPLGAAVLTKLLQAPPSEWPSLATAGGQAFAARELLVWSQDLAVQSALVARGWDGSLPTTDGDFFYNGEFEYAAKNGRGLRRAFDHRVELRADGSALVGTTIRITNTEDANPNANHDVLSYITVYGPAGAVLDRAADRPVASEPSFGGHPAYGWLVSLLPHTTVSIKVVWVVPALGRRLTNGAWVYGLRWLPVVDNQADEATLTVVLPPHGHWVGKPPPAQSRLDRVLAGAWEYRL